MSAWIGAVLNPVCGLDGRGDPGGARILFLKLDNLTNLTLRGGEVVFLNFLSDLFFFTNFERISLIRDQSIFEMFQSLFSLAAYLK